MSRRLDALFAERVLGKTGRCGAFLNRSCGFVCDLPFGHDGGHESKTEPARWSDDTRGASGGMPHYTTSLDAAWEGVESAQPQFYLAVSSPVPGKYEATVGDDVRTADHPALAIVLACLRAVGVSEEEIRAARD